MTLAIEQPATRTTTADELLRMSDNSGMELVNGRVVEKNVSLESSKIERQFLVRFQGFLDGHPVAEVFPASLGYQCFQRLDEDPDRVRKPDATVVRVERLKELPNPNPGYMPIVPDLAVEVISPNDLVYEVDEKVQEYLRAGFPLVWVADPKARTIVVYGSGQRPAIYAADDEVTAEGVLPGFRCKVSDFFPPPQGRQPPSPASAVRQAT